MKGSAPNVSATGSQIFFERKVHPKAWRDSPEFLHNSQAIATAMAKMLRAKRSVMPLKRRSPHPLERAKTLSRGFGGKEKDGGGRSSIRTTVILLSCRWLWSPSGSHSRVKEHSRGYPP